LAPLSYYARGTHRRNGGYADVPRHAAHNHIYDRMQQHRDVALRHAFMHRLHGAVISQAPTVSFTEATIPIEHVPYSVELGLEGVTPGD
jgi:hypothetical protein